ncbi:MAG TPA: DMT family transporter [Jatrophihabitantaceae bacterium]
MPILSLVLAALAATGNAAGAVLQRKAALLTQDAEFGRGVLRRLIHMRVWLFGILCMVAAFILHATALDQGQLSAVEPIIALELPLSLLFASWAFQSGLGRLEWASTITMTGGVIVVLTALSPTPGKPTGVSHTTYVLAGSGTAGTVAALCLLGRVGRGPIRAAALGAAAGTSFGLTASLVKESMSQLSHRGLFGLVSTWQTYAAICFGVLGVILVQAALHAGRLVAAQPGITLMDPLVSTLWGVLVFDEQTRGGVYLWIAALGAVAMLASVLVLARSPLLEDNSEDAPRVASPRPEDPAACPHPA